MTASTYRKVGVSNPLVVNGFCDPLKSGALYNHFYFTLSKHNYCLGVDAKSGKQKQCTVKKACYKPLWSVSDLLGSVSCLLRVAIRC